MMGKMLRVGIAAVVVSICGVPSVTSQTIQEKETSQPRKIGLRATPLSNSDPKYPAALVGSGLGAEVILRFTIDETGAVSGIRIKGESDVRQEFRDAAISAVKAWSYSPAQNSDGKQVRVTAEQKIVFKP